MTDEDPKEPPGGIAPPAETGRESATLGQNPDLWAWAFDAIPDLLVILDNRHRIVRVNRAMAARLGLPPEACIGRSCFESVHGTAEPPPFCPHTLTCRDGREHVAEVEEPRLGGHFLVSTTPILNGQGRPLASLHLARDITARKRAEEDLQRTAAELARSNQDLEQFAYVASHDLKEPLRMVTGFLDLLQGEYQERLDARANRFIAFAAEAATRMQNLIDDLLAYSRVGRGEPTEVTDAAAAADRALENLQASIAAAVARVTRDPLPTVRANGGQLTQVFQNLIGNAVKFRGDRPPEVHLGARREAERWVFTVRDNGIGIDPRYQDRLFAIFQRLHPADEYPGTGMGLAICRKLIERHGGTIWVESHPGEGSTFCFTLPA